MSRPEDVVDAETAEAELERFTDLMDLDLAKAIAKNEAKAGEDGTNAFLEAKATVLKAIRRGTVVVDDEGQIIFTPQAGDNRKPITFAEPTGSTFTAAKGNKDPHESARLMMASMTREIPARFAQMKARDLAVCNAVILLFLAAM